MAQVEELLTPVATQFDEAPVKAKLVSVPLLLFPLISFKELTLELFAPTIP